MKRKNRRKSNNKSVNLFLYVFSSFARDLFNLRTILWKWRPTMNCVSVCLPLSYWEFGWRQYALLKATINLGDDSINKLVFWYLLTFSFCVIGLTDLSCHEVESHWNFVRKRWNLISQSTAAGMCRRVWALNWDPNHSQKNLDQELKIHWLEAKYGMQQTKTAQLF